MCARDAMAMVGGWGGVKTNVAGLVAVPVVAALFETQNHNQIRGAYAYLSATYVRGQPLAHVLAVDP